MFSFECYFVPIDVYANDVIIGSHHLTVLSKNKIKKNVMSVKGLNVVIGIILSLINRSG